MRAISLVAISLTLVVVSLAIHAENQSVYKWTDENGVTHYTQQPPAGEQFERQDVRVPQAARADEKAADADAKPESDMCLRVRANLKVLEESQVVTMDIDGDGAPDTLSAEQRQAQLDIAKQQMAAYCK